MINNVIDFIDIKIVKCEFELNLDYNAEKFDETEIDISFEPSILIKEDDEQDGLMKISVTIFDEEFKDHDKPLFLEMEVQGHFRTKKDGEPLVNYYTNCFNILLPYLRSYVTTYTALAGIKAITFPPVNIYDLLEGISDKQELPEE